MPYACNQASNGIFITPPQPGNTTTPGNTGNTGNTGNDGPGTSVEQTPETLDNDAVKRTLESVYKSAPVF